MKILLFFLLASQLSHLKAENCITTYQDLKNSIRNNSTGNVVNLLRVFYPSNTKIEPHYVEVVYNISGTNTTKHYYWTDIAILANIEYKLLNALTFGIVNLKDNRADDLNISPFCKQVNETDIDQQLKLLTSWLKSYATSDNEDPKYKGFVPDVSNLNKASINIADIHVVVNDKNLIALPVFLITSAVAASIVICQFHFSKTFRRRIQTIMKETVGAVTQVTSLPIAKNLLQAKQTESIQKKLRSPSAHTSKDVAIEIDDDEASNLVEDTSTSAHKLPNLFFSFGTWLFFMIEDFISFYKYNNNTIKLESIPSQQYFTWLGLFPLFPSLIFLIASALVILILFFLNGMRSCCNRGYKDNCKGWCACATLKDFVNLTLFTTLPVFLIYHGFWIIIIMFAFPSRVAIAALFYGPLLTCFVVLYVPIFDYMCCKFLCKSRTDNWCTLSYICNCKCLHICNCKCLIEIVSNLIISLFWGFFLYIMNKFSYILLDIGGAQDDFFKALVLAVAVIGVVYRFTTICKPKFED